MSEDEEKQIKEILNEALNSSDKNFRLKSIDRVALYGKAAITLLFNFGNTINDMDLKNYTMTKIREIKTKNA